MKATLAVMIFASVSMLGCKDDPAETLPSPEWVSVSSIKSVSVTNRTLSFTVVCVVSESCWRFARIENQASGQSVMIFVYAQRTTNGPCAQVLTSIDAPGSFTVPSAGTYTFRFKRLETTIDTTINFQ
jgi:hypothetical protein